MRGTTPMRVLAAPFIAATVALGASVVDARTEPQPSARPVVLLVHGRGLYGLDSAGLRREWKRDLDEGLHAAGAPALPDADVRLAWYADVLDPAGEGKCVGRTESAELDLGGFARALLASLGSTLEREGAVEGRGLLGDLLFMVDPATRCGARRRVSEAVRAVQAEGRPLVIVAYSLGSVVTYDLLRALDANASSRDIHLVTIGSPLGVPALRELLGAGGGSALRVPRSVRSWVNVYDPADVFAAPLGAEAAAALDDRTTTGAGERADPHHISRYLRDPETGAAVARAVCASAVGQPGTGCTRT